MTTVNVEQPLENFGLGAICSLFIFLIQRAELRTDI